MMVNRVLGRLGPDAKYLLRKSGRILGFDIRLNGPSARDDLRLLNFLSIYEIDLVLDIGANRGQFAEMLISMGYKGRIVSFEALPDAHGELLQKAKPYGDRWMVAPAMALSDREGTTTFHLNSADATSSLLKVAEKSLSSMPGARPKSKIEVRTIRIDRAIKEMGLDVARAFLKIDVQGAESLVLAGAEETLKVASGLIVELSFTQLYENQYLAFDVLPNLLAKGYEVYDIWQGYRDPRTYRLYQIDATLFHPDRIAPG